MPITRTVQGLIYLDNFEDIGSWIDFTFGDGIEEAGAPDGSNCARGEAYSDMYQNTPACLCKSIDLGQTDNRRVHAWHKTSSNTNAFFRAFCIVASCGAIGTIRDSPLGGPYDRHTNWQLHSGTLLNNYKGVQSCAVCWTQGEIGIIGFWQSYVDILLICKSDYLIVDGLTVGQKVEWYRASNDTKIDEATVGAGETSVTISVLAEIQNQLIPELIYLKIYGTDGSTLIETTASYQTCAGDTWTWTAGAGTLKITVDEDVIYRQAAAGTPKTCNITANLKTLGGANYPNATIYFSTTLGTVSPGSDVTDANGNAETALTSTNHGIAVIEANWLGDATVPACSAYYLVHVFYEAEEGDSDKDFQFYCQGIEFVYCSGKYRFNEEGRTDTFEAQIPEWIDTITKNGLIGIYRKGVKEFAGVLRMIDRSLSDSPRVTLRGSDVSILLDTRVVDIQIYTDKTPQYILGDLLAKFPCGIITGSLGVNPDTITVTIDTESLYKAIERVVDLVGWVFRINANRTLDFAANFTGTGSSAVFIEGDNIFDAERLEDFYSMKNYIRMKGDGITSVKQDGTRIKEYGLLQAPAYQKKIATQATLDIACQAELDLKKDASERIGIEVKDDYPVGTFGCEDSITITSPMIGLSGSYTVKSIERDLTDVNYARLELSNRSIELWELDETYRRMTKDASI
jgi:hypothetical protein